MAKLTKAVCDFCVGPLGKRYATLTVPVSKPDGSPVEEPKSDFNYIAMLTLMGGPSSSGKTRTYDMCIGCAEGLTKWRHAAIEKLMADGFVKVDA